MPAPLGYSDSILFKMNDRSIKVNYNVEDAAKLAS